MTSRYGRGLVFNPRRGWHSLSLGRKPVDHALCLIFTAPAGGGTLGRVEAASSPLAQERDEDVASTNPNEAVLCASIGGDVECDIVIGPRRGDGDCVNEFMN